MLVPKRVKHRREFRGKMRGEAKGGKEIAYGEYGLQALDSKWITNRQIEADPYRDDTLYETWRESMD